MRRRVLRGARALVGLATPSCALATLGLATSLGAQGRVEGFVTDGARGRGIAGARVSLEGPDTLVLGTDALGRWRATLIAGDYRVRVRAIGFIAPPPSTLQVKDGDDRRHEVSLAAAVLTLDQVVVSAARRAERLGDAVATIEVVSRADIERTGATDLASVLTEQSGVELQGGHPAGSGIMLQGFGSERVLVLLDGQPVAGRISGVFDVSRIPVSMVERIEVVKGAQSTLHGSEAMGGVVNIITRTPARATTSGSASVTAGSQARRDAGTSLTLGRRDVSLAFDLGRRSIASSPGVADGSGALAERLDVAARARWSPDSARMLEASVLALDERQRWRSAGFHAFGDNRQLNARLTGSLLFGNERHRLSPGAWVSHYDHRARSSTGSLPVAGDTGQRQLQRVQQGELLYNGRFTGALAVDAGVQVRVDAIETERVQGGPRSHTSVEPFAQLELKPSRALTLLPGVRYSHSTEWGSHVTPRVSARLRLTDLLTLRASIGDGFRAPDFKELHMFFHNASADYAVLGNPNLRPESSRGTMLGAELATPAGYFRGQLFRNAFRDFIEAQAITAPGEPPVYQYGNISSGSTRGAELEAGANLSVRGDLRLEGSYSLLETRDDATDRPLLGRPSHAARAIAGGTLPWRLRATATALFTGRTPMARDASTGAITSHRDAFTRVDVRLARAMAGGLEVAAGTDNLFDRWPAEWAGPTGRHTYVTLTWTFSRTEP